ncbi:MAG: methionyl-tRNA formyltransferase [Dehalococcoidia bacterium]|nr:methionyl-tRNA formyltransferase [Dehalococcoidia bacterium]
MKKRIIFMGTPEFAVPSLEALIHGGYQVVAVYTQPDRRAGRGQQIMSSSVKQLALSQGLDVVQIEKFKVAGTVEKLAALAPDLIVVAAFGLLLPPAVLNLPKLGCLNVHSSLLPRHRGASPVAAAILQGDEKTGVTIMLLDAGMDTGPILNQREVPVSDEDTTGSLSVKLAQVGAQLLMETLPLWIEGRIKPRPQDDGAASYSKIIKKEDGEVDWRLSAQELWRRVRAFDPWPGCYARWRDKRLKLVKVSPLYGEKSDEPGRVIALPPPAPVTVGVQTGDGVLGLVKIQLEGKRELSSEEFVRGQRDFIGSRLL